MVDLGESNFKGLMFHSKITQANQVVQIETLETRRLLSAADLDASFGFSGRTAVDLGRHGGFEDMVVLSDGKILVAGRITSPSGKTSDAMLLRYNADGSFDRSFGDNALVRLDFGGNESFRSLALSSDGKIVIGGNLSTSEYLLARYNADGLPDNTFGVNGVATGPGEIIDLAVQGEKVITASSSALRRHMSNGILDQTFGNGGILDQSQLDLLEDEFGNHLDWDEVHTVSVNGQGQIFVGGWATLSDEDDFILMGAVRRLDLNGVSDRLQTFGDAGPVVDLAIQPNGKILILSLDGFSRLTADLDWDGAFAPDPDGVNYVRGGAGNALSFQPDGRILVVGSDHEGLHVSRFVDGGIPDESFSSGNGTNPSIIAGELATGIAIAVAPDGGILVAGDSGVTLPFQSQIAFGARHAGFVAKLIPNPVGEIASHVRLVDQKLRINGTDTHDSVSISTDGQEVLVEMNGEAMRFALAAVQRVSASLGAGNDFFSIGSGFPRRTTIDGGAGDDLLFGGNRNDLIMGGDGFDGVHGHGGNDSLFGNASQDGLWGGGGNDVLDGGSSDDDLYGGSGDDVLYGQGGDDRFTGGEGRDSLFGGSGIDLSRPDDEDLLASIEDTWICGVFC